MNRTSDMTPSREGEVSQRQKKVRPSLVSHNRVAVLCSTLWSIRNVVLSGLLAKLKSHGVDPFLLISKEFAHTLPAASVAAEGVAPLLVAPIVKPTQGKPLLDALLHASFARRYQILSYPIFSEWLKNNNSGLQVLKDLGVEWLSRLGCKDSFYYWQIDNLDRFLRRTRDFSPIKEQLKALDPTLLISTNCTEGTECQYVRAAGDLDIATLNWVLSFDNLTSRGCLPLFDFYAVWNERMKAQVLRLYPERKPTEIHVTGTTQFDFHFRQDLSWSRDDTLAHLGLKSGDRYLLYAANSTLWTPSEPRLIEELSHLLAGCPALRAHRIVVRMHPLDRYSRWEHFADRSGDVIISQPWRQDGNGFGVDDQAFLINSLAHADVCINMASTISLDAAVLDTPVVCVAFAVEQGSAEDRFCRRVYQTEHYHALVESGGLRLATSMDELVAEILSYVQDPKRDCLRREELVREEVGQVDGRASERMASFVARMGRETLLQKAAFI